MKLKMTIRKIKCIDYLEIDLSIQKGLYAITGENSSGKSTLVTCAAMAFFNFNPKEFYGEMEDGSSISFNFEGNTKTCRNNKGYWRRRICGNFDITGFYEGSLLYGNRFRNASYNNIRTPHITNDDMLEEAPDFIRENLGIILHNDKNFYERLQLIPSKTYQQLTGLGGDLFYYQKGAKRISQFHMSTGENLLTSVLNSIYIRNKTRDNLSKPCLVFLDEIELALHPSSLMRLLKFLQDMSNQYNYAIYFSTHSIELIGAIKPENIYFLDRHADNTLEVVNPCYPAYATRFLYDHTGYDNIVLVEDDLARELVGRLLRKHALFTSRLVYVLPCGEWANVIRLAQEVVISKLAGKTANIEIVLDGDVEQDAQKFIADNRIANNIPLNYLPIQSLENS